MDDQEWLAALKPGDKVYATSRLSSRVLTVERLTKTLVVLDDGSRWNWESSGDSLLE